MATKFSSPPGQRFECRDCPARCCRVPWSIRFSDEESARYLAEPWVRERAGAGGLAVIERGVLPMAERERRLQCVFLDDDRLCAMQKRFGHSYIPRACQVFPFGFVRDERGDAVAQLSLLCPSIRDNYGAPVAKQLDAKLTQLGQVERMATAMSTLGRVLLSQRQYLRVAHDWTQELGRLLPADALAVIYDRTLAFERALPGGADRVGDKAVESAIEGARAHLPEPLEPRARPSFHGRALYSYLLGNLSYPARVRQPHRVGPAPALQGVRGLGNKLAWLRGRGTVDLLFAPRPFKLQAVAKVDRVLGGPHSALVTDFLATLIARRHLFTRPRYLMDVVVDLCMAAVVIARFARCMAASAGRTEVADADVREAMGVAELVLSSHVTLAQEGKTVKNLRMLWLADRAKLRLLLAGEA